MGGGRGRRPGARRRVTAEVDGTGALTLSGAKTAVQDVEAGSWLLVTCRTAAGATQALVPADAAWRHGHPAPTRSI
ncbi:MAG: hypothetical protein R2755_33270 [Acidimicrobiales bacterium]